MLQIIHFGEKDIEVYKGDVCSIPLGYMQYTWSIHMHASCIPHVLPMYSRCFSVVYSYGIAVLQVVDVVTNHTFW